MHTRKMVNNRKKNSAYDMFRRGLVARIIIIIVKKLPAAIAAGR